MFGVVRWAKAHNLGRRYPDARYVLDEESQADSNVTMSLDGVRWDYARLPPRRHWCWVQTKAFNRTRPVSFRCACGAVRNDRRGMWINRNYRRTRRYKRESGL